MRSAAAAPRGPGAGAAPGPPFAPAAVVLAVFALAGVAVVDDFGVSWDEELARTYAPRVIDYVLGVRDLPDDWNRYYGVVVEMPLFLIERLLGLADSRAIYLSRHLLTHLFFLAGGFFCYLLVYRRFGDRWLALFALLLFLLHPRLYPHSFYNSKDVPFLALFMIALYLLERALRRDTAAAFALCGVGVGVLVNLRVMGIMLPAAVAGLLALDLLQARGWAARRRVLAAAGAFVLAAAGTLYAVSPHLWRDPRVIVDVVATMAGGLAHVITLFQGEPVRWPWIPPHYLPTWMAITTPPATLLLSLIGIAAVVRRGIARPRDVAANTGVRFAWLLLACLALPVAAIATLRSNIYNGWRHVYFLYAPLCLLAVYGLRALLSEARRRRGGSLRQNRLLRRALYALAAAALAAMAADGLRLHPHQQAYFNFLVDRRTPERLNTRYAVLYWATEYREALEFLLERYPDDTFYVDRTFYLDRHVLRNRAALPPAARRRILVADEAGRPADFFIATNYRHFGRAEPPFGPILHSLRIYHNTVMAVTAVDLSLVDQATAGRYRATYRETVAGEPLFRSEFDLYLDGRTLTYVKESCAPEDTMHQFLLRAAPVAGGDLPVIRRQSGWDPLSFRFGHYGVRFDGRCLIRRILPDYPIRALGVGRWLPETGNLLEATIDLRAGEPAVSPFWQAHQAVTAGELGAPAARARFDLYLDETAGTLTYHREPCLPADLRARFFLHLFPAAAAELAAGRRQSGFANHDFDYAEHGVLFGAACVALVPLPAYQGGIARIRTGQFISGQGQLWSAELRAGE